MSRHAPGSVSMLSAARPSVSTRIPRHRTRRSRVAGGLLPRPRAGSLLARRAGSSIGLQWSNCFTPRGRPVADASGIDRDIGTVGRTVVHDIEPPVAAPDENRGFTSRYPGSAPPPARCIRASLCGSRARPNPGSWMPRRRVPTTAVPMRWLHRVAQSTRTSRPMGPVPSCSGQVPQRRDCRERVRVRWIGR